MSLIPEEEFKFGTYGAIDIRPCKARTELLKWCDRQRKNEFKIDQPIKLIIEAEFDGGVQSGFDGIGQEFTILVKNVRIK